MRAVSASRFSAALALAVALARPGTAQAVDWPVAQGSTPGGDLLEPLRWRHIPSWFASAPDRTRSALALIDRGPADDPRTLAARAVALRQLNHEDEARADLARAVAARPEVLDDADIALTAAYLAARAHDYPAAVDLARRALARMDTASPRADLVLEVSRWSMARGPDGLAPAIALLRSYLAVSAGTPLVRATLALALDRTGQPEAQREARALASALRPNLRQTDGDRDSPLIAPTVLGEGRAAVGVCLLLAGDPAGAREAIVPLARAASTVPPPWRAFQSTLLATARRAAPDVSLPVDPDAPVPTPPRRTP